MFKSRELADHRTLNKVERSDIWQALEVAHLDGYNDAKLGFAPTPQGFSVASGLAKYTDAYNKAYTEGYSRVTR